MNRRLHQYRAPTLEKTRSIVEMLTQFALAGGRDWETYERILDHLARRTHFTWDARSALEPDIPTRAAAAVEEAAGLTPPPGRDA